MPILIKALKKPLVLTSANFSGEAYPTCFDEIDAELKNGVDEIINERLTEKQISPSQIIKIGLDSSIKIVRK